MISRVGHIRVMGVENPSPTLVGLHLPPVVTGGRTVAAPAAPEDEAAASARVGEDREGGLADGSDGNLRSGQSIVHPEAT